jgi:hypothetical protein
MNRRTFILASGIALVAGPQVVGALPLGGDGRPYILIYVERRNGELNELRVPLSRQDAKRVGFTQQFTYQVRTLAWGLPGGERIELPNFVLCAGETLTVEHDYVLSRV